MESIRFDNLALRALPIDPVEENYVRTVSGACFSKVNPRENDHSHQWFTFRSFEVKPTPVKSPKLVVCSPDALKLIGIDEEAARVRIGTGTIAQIYDVCLISRTKHS